MRLNSFLASCGVASRRKSELIIFSGRVQINNKIVLAPFLDVGEDDVVKVDGEIVKLPEKFVYYVMNKPAGYVCAASDKYDPVILDLLPAEKNKTRLFPVGRLDKESEGLIIITNDGKFTQSILHPSSNIKKTYEALLNLPVNDKKLSIWQRGFKNSDGHLLKPLSIKILKREPENFWVSVEIIEGLKREVRLMARNAGFNVKRLIRRKIGKMILKDLETGGFVDLSISDLQYKIFSGGAV